MLPPLYVITDGEADALLRLQAALSAVPDGSLAVQLRNRTCTGAALFHFAERLRSLTAQHRTLLFINDRLDVALAVAADGVHLPGHGLPPQTVRRIGGSHLQISAATHSLQEASAAARAGADCVTFGPIWPTPSKLEDFTVPEQARVYPVGLSPLGAVTAALPIPVFALGGIDTPERAAKCAASGARTACLRGILFAPDPAAAAAAMLSAVVQNLKAVR